MHNTDTWLWPAIFGLVGVIVGSVIISATEMWLEHHRERRIQRQAVRTLLGEFMALHALIAFRLDTETPWRFDAGRVLAVWDAHTSALIGLGSPDWGDVWFTVHAVRRMHGLDLNAIRWDATADNLRRILRDLHGGIQVLNRYA